MAQPAAGSIARTGHGLQRNGGGNVTDSQVQGLVDIVALRLMNKAAKNPPEFTFNDNPIQRTAIGSQDELEKVVEDLIDIDLGGLDMLYMQSDKQGATSIAQWARLVHSYLDERYQLDDDLSIDNVEVAVSNVKNDHREEMLGRMANNLSDDVPPWDIDELKRRLREKGAFLEEDDDYVLQQILNGTLGGDIDYSADWIEEDGEISSFPAGADDLETLIDQCSGNLHSASIGTVVGGMGVKGTGVKKVKGLTYPSARIDRQNPPAGAFNIQFQIDETSHACVIFVPADPREVVLAKLLESFNKTKVLRSPRVNS